MKMNNILTQRPSAAVEYWFFKVNAGPVALLVDWICRRDKKQNWLRVSIHSPVRREVLFEVLQGDVMTKDSFLSLSRTTGQIKDVSWDLVIDPGTELVVPDIFPAGLLRLTDLQLVTAPVAIFSGSIKHGDKSYSLQGAKGMISHYWGRQLASEWWWISANQFSQAGLTIECSFFKSSLWGSRYKMPLAYLYIKDENRKMLIMGTPGSVSVKGTPENFELRVRGFAAKPVTIKGTGREYGDFGEGIINTLVGDLEVMIGKEVIGQAKGTAGLERRFAGLTHNGIQSISKVA